MTTPLLTKLNHYSSAVCDEDHFLTCLLISNITTLPWQDLWKQRHGGIWITHDICHTLSKAFYICYFSSFSSQPDEKSIILSEQIIKLSTEKLSHLLRTMWPVINEVEFYPLLCWVPKPIILTANYISPLFQKTKEHGNSDSKQASFDILRSVLHKGNVFASYCCCSKLLPIWWLKPIEFFFFLIARDGRSLKWISLG